MGFGDEIPKQVWAAAHRHPKIAERFKTQSGSEAIPDGGFLQTPFKPKKLKALFVRLKTPDEEGFFELYSRFFQKPTDRFGIHFF